MDVFITIKLHFRFIQNEEEYELEQNNRIPKPDR